MLYFGSRSFAAKHMTKLRNLIADAYNMAQHDGRTNDAVLLLRHAPRDEMSAELLRLDAVVKKRGARACHISAVSQKLLRAALAEE